MNDVQHRRWRKGKKNTLYFYRRKLSFKARSFNCVFPLPDYFAPFIGKKKSVTIADLGAGMFSTTGSCWKTSEVKVYPSDILADEYNKMLKAHNVTPIVPVEQQDMMNLTYADNFFDIVHCVNALDHCVDPKHALSEMYRICKPDGWIYLRHFKNSGEYQEYKGFHLWNICLHRDNDCMIWNREERFTLNDCIKNGNTVEITDTEQTPPVTVVTTIHKNADSCI